MFDVLTYQKGAAVLRMLEQYLGAEPFRQGIVDYLNKHSYGNAETTDLWDALEESTGEPVRALMDSWIFQGGYPLVTVERAPDGAGLELSSTSSATLDDGDPDARWQVPVLLARRQAAAGGRSSPDRSADVDLGGKADAAVVNDGGWGFYRVQYPLERLPALVASGLTPLERFNLVSDTWAAVLAGRTPARSTSTELLRLLADDDDPNVWTAMLGPLAFLDKVVPDGGRAALEAFVQGLAGPAFARLGWEPTKGESDGTAAARRAARRARDIGGDPDIRGEAAERHARYVEDRSALHPDLVAPVISIVAQTGGEAEYTTFLDALPLAGHAAGADPLPLRAGRVPVEPLVQRTLDLAVTEVRTQNAPFVINAAIGNRVAGDLAWDFVKSRWDELAERFPHKMLDRMVTNVMYLTERADDVHAFFADHPIPTGQKQLEQTLERLDIHAAFRTRNAERHRRRPVAALVGRLERLDAGLDAGEALGGEGVEAAGFLVERGGLLDADVAGRHAVGERLELGHESARTCGRRRRSLPARPCRAPRRGRRAGRPPRRCRRGRRRPRRPEPRTTMPSSDDARPRSRARARAPVPELPSDGAPAAAGRRPTQEARRVHELEAGGGPLEPRSATPRPASRARAGIDRLERGSARTWRCSKPARAWRSRSASARSSSTRDGTTAAAAPSTGVPHRRSATSSHSGRSPSWPMADTTGVVDAHDGPAQLLVAEREQLGGVAATAGEDDDLDLGAGVEGAQRADDRLGGAGARHRHLGELDRIAGEPDGDDRLDVGPHGRLAAAHDADDLGQPGDRVAGAGRAGRRPPRRRRASATAAATAPAPTGTTSSASNWSRPHSFWYCERAGDAHPLAVDRAAPRRPRRRAPHRDLRCPVAEREVHPAARPRLGLGAPRPRPTRGRSPPPSGRSRR